MIIMGAGICQWFHGDATYRAILALLILTGSMGRNGGGWAHYVGQEKCRPITGWISLANALDWNRPPRTQPGTSFWYMHTDQWRNDGYSADALASPLAKGHLTGHTADTIAASARMGWMPFYPQFDRNSLQIGQQAAQAVESGEAPDAATYVKSRLADGSLKPAIADIDAPESWPRTLILWRSNLLGSSAKGNEYFLRHLLGTHHNVLGSENPNTPHPETVRWHDEAPEGKLDLLVSADFRMTSTTLLSDVIFPAATWYEKHDLSSTDMHPYVHAFTPAIDPPWEAKSDFELFHLLARRLSELAEDHLGTVQDLVSVPLQHDTPGEALRPGGSADDDHHPLFSVVERDYTKIAEQLAAVGPLADSLGFTVKNVTFPMAEQTEKLGKQNGVMLGGIANGRPAIDTDSKLAEAILSFSGTTNGELAVAGFKELEKRVGKKLADLAEGSEEKRITFAATQAAPVPVITSPEWSGSETGGRRYAPFTVNIERLKPFHTLTGRMHFYLDHDWMTDVGEALPIYRPPLDMHRLFGEPKLGPDGSATITVRYLTPHSKWSIHSEYQDNLFMLSLSRGGPTVWMSPQDASAIEVHDNDWVECTNANGVLVCRAIVTHKMPSGVVYVYHAQERTIDVPKSEATGRRGGIHNSVTRLLVKPTHLIGGYAQLSYTFNYLGPTGNQRDMVTTVRKRSQEVTY
jgi:nitrate reductase alpha subunit